MHPCTRGLVDWCAQGGLLFSTPLTRGRSMEPPSVVVEPSVECLLMLYHVPQYFYVCYSSRCGTVTRTNFPRHCHILSVKCQVSPSPRVRPHHTSHRRTKGTELAFETCAPGEPQSSHNETAWIGLSATEIWCGVEGESSQPPTHTIQ